jgi:hypothetical protein
VIAALAVAAILMQSQPPARDLRPVRAAGTAIVAGVVVSADAQARPLRRVRVTINGPALVPGRTAITADDGSFSFERVPAGRVTLAAAKDGYVTMSYGATRPGRPGTGVTVADGQAVRVSIRLPLGAVITGTVVDAEGLPSPGITVRALEHTYVGQQGERRFVGAGMPALAASDDRGVYRIFGLPAGDYIVAAQPQQTRGGSQGLELRTVSRGVVSEKGQIMTQVFHPGATEVARATRVTVRAGEERSGIDIQVQYVPLARIGGIAAVGAGWTPARLTMVRVDEVPGFEPVRSARADADGRFTIDGVPPGRYRLMAGSVPASPLTTSGSPLIVSRDLLTASADISVNGEDVESVSLSLHPALTVSGRLAFEGGRAVQDIGPRRVPMPMSLDLANAGQAFPVLELESGGTFTVSGIVPGPYRLLGNLQGVRTPIGAWWLKSLVVGGRDALDAPLDLRQSADDAVATLADTASEVSGVVKDAQGNAVTDHFVVAASTDRSTWFFNSRRVVGVRPDLQGRYAIRNLPPGEYRIVAAADLEPGEWFDPAVLQRLLPAAEPFTIAGVEKQTRDLVIRN